VRVGGGFKLPSLREVCCGTRDPDTVAEAAAGDRSTAFPFVSLASLRSGFCVGS